MDFTTQKRAKTVLPPNVPSLLITQEGTLC